MSEEKEKEYGCTKKCEPCRRKIRDEEQRQTLIHRLNRVEGQIRGINGMIMNDVYCVDVITQVMAAQSALNAISRVLLTEHMKTCVAEELRSGNRTTVDELAKTMQKLMK